MTEKIVFHKHHLIPKHRGGTDNSSNIIKVNVALHAFLHKLLWEEHGRWQDELAYKMLLKEIGKDEIFSYIGKSRKGQPPWNKGIKNPYSEETLKKLHKSRIGNYRSGEEHPQYGKMRTSDELEKIIKNQPKRKPIKTPYGEFISVRDAVRKLDFTRTQIKYRLKSINYPEWSY